MGPFFEKKMGSVNFCYKVLKSSKKFGPYMGDPYVTILRVTCKRFIKILTYKQVKKKVHWMGYYLGFKHLPYLGYSIFLHFCEKTIQVLLRTYINTSKLYNAGIWKRLLLHIKNRMPCFRYNKNINCVSLSFFSLFHQ